MAFGLHGGAVMAKVLCTGVATALAACLAVPSAGQEPAKPMLAVEFRWIEPQVVKGVTEDKGKPIVCGGLDWFAHLNPS